MATEGSAAAATAGAEVAPMLQPDGLAVSQEAQEYVRGLIERAKETRLPEVLQDRNPRAYYQHLDRHGVSSIAIAQCHLSDAAMEEVLRFRLANAILYGHVHPQPIYERRSECEWWFTGSPDDVLLFAGSSRTGEIGSHQALAFLPGSSEHMTLRTPDRPLFEAEQIYGWQAFHVLPLVPYLPINRLVEPRRLTKTYWLDPLDELAFRAPAELGTASFHAMAGPLAERIDVILGEMTNEAERNLDFFGSTFVTFAAEPDHTATPVFHLPVDYVRTSLWAMLTAEVHSAASRVAEIEAALEMPGRECLRELLRLGAGAPHHRSQVLHPRRLAGRQ